MKLSEYLKARDESQTEFAERAGVQQRTVSRLVQGRGCNAETAHKIIRATHAAPTPTGGTVSLDDLVSSEAAA